MDGMKTRNLRVGRYLSGGERVGWVKEVSNFLDNCRANQLYIDRHKNKEIKQK